MNAKMMTLAVGVLAFALFVPWAVVVAADTAVQPVLARPTVQQLKFADWEIGVFIHYGMSTYSGDYGDGNGTAKPTLFNPTELNARQWVRSAKEMGAKYAILTARHTDGFCLWPTAFTDYSVKSSPWKNGKGDVVREFMDACREFGIEPCLYFWTLSCNDLYQPGKPTNRKYYENVYWKEMRPEVKAAIIKRQVDEMRELVTQYHPKYIWIDHWDAPEQRADTINLSTELSKAAMEADPDCIVMGPHTWHAGDGEVAWRRYPNWNATDTRDGSLFTRPKSMNDGSEKYLSGNLELYTDVYTGQPDGKYWRPSEAYTTKMLCSHWFWGPKPESSPTIDGRANVDMYYYRTVGLGANLLLNFNPDRRGKLPDRTVAGAKNFGDELRRQFAPELLVAQTKGVETGDTVELRWEKPCLIDRIVLMENIVNGQKVAKYILEAMVDGQWHPLIANNVYGFKAKAPAGYETIGHKKIDRVKPVTATGVRFRCLKSVAGPVEIRSMMVYASCN